MIRVLITFRVVEQQAPREAWVKDIHDGQTWLGIWSSVDSTAVMPQTWVNVATIAEVRPL